jgi:hypothetical protein
MSNYNLASFLTGIWVGIIGISIIDYAVPSSTMKCVRDELKACEAKLPSDHRCWIVAVPEEKK